jgi:Kef-type K+ transport system membrane component KefB
MPDVINILLLLGAALLLGFVGGKSTERLRSPQVVGFIVIGVIIGNLFPEILDTNTLDNLDVISFLALSFIGFDVGGEMALKVLKKLGKSILGIAIFEALGAFLLVFLSIYFVTKEVSTALIFGALASATAPAATVDVLREYRASGPLTSTLFGVVAIDDAIAIVIYGVASAYAKIILGNGELSFIKILWTPFTEIAGSLILGFVLGVALHILITKIHDKRELLILTLAIILLNSGTAINLHLSLILANMALGMTLINLSTHGDKRAFEALTIISPSVYILFFVLVGARLSLRFLPAIGVIGLVYIGFRSFGKFGGAFLGARVSGSSETIKRYVGFGLLSQAGVAVGLSIQAWHEFGGYGPEGFKLGLLAINVIAATTFIFQIIGPQLTKFALYKAGEVQPEQVEET